MAVRFADRKNLRLVVKNTGHDFLGRSTGYGALSVWTHHMKNITYHESFTVEKCPISSVHKAATMGAGVQVGEVYEALEKHGMTMVGGADPTVGMMGWFQGGGHGPLSSSYGMGAHNLLQATVVLATGDVVTTNACSFPDLFYALRGGGGGTFGIVVSATMRVFPSPKTTHHTFSLSTKGSQYQKDFYNTAAWVLTQFPALKDAGLQGYFRFRKYVTSTGPALSLNWGFYLFDKSAESMEALFQPIRDALTTEGNSTLLFFSRVASAPTFYQQFLISSEPEPVAMMNGAMGGWLMSREALKDVSRLARTLEIAGPTMDGADALKDLAPDMGAYFNEHDPKEPFWKHTLFGPNYASLLSIKRLYDPEGLLYCRHCVGSDQWEEQADGALCQSKGWEMAELGDGDDDEGGFY
ncbi:hypothetical protein FKW77_007483 [Venturia effusa]|uniref:FAD-binding PCMH-type domain-containing protein n=1 Tax=Venturia effusa TaxID=50376 RepID=A0A517LKI3_9PEZI|nr:hypothetical protein FKW77_007483 [Venturia effusa]